ncbi:MAG TPA: ABC transporter ATP-binding protein [Chloroflexota bacterium]|nr:ABC transporter ATP-binding protein [Chloroflexota bacterium]
MTALLEARDVSRVFGSGPEATVALDHFSLAVGDDVPSFTTIAGESGSGKTTLARLLLGFTQPTSGEVFYRGKNLWKMARRDWMEFRHEVQAIFQDPFEVFNPFYKVDHLLTVPVAKFRLARSQAQARSKIEEALVAVGLRPEETLGRYPHQLSGGQRQRLTVARALLLQPRLIIADEPVSMVDASLRATILESLKKLHADFGISFLYITHDLTTAYQISDNIIVLYRGGVAEVGDVDLVIKAPRHPYSQLLISSIPLPDVNDRWDDDDQSLASRAEPERATMHGCRFADRCPAVMPMCAETVPPLYRTDDRRAAACFLYRDAPTLGGANMDQVLAHTARAATQSG